MKYIGNGDSIPGIPARDLDEEEVKKFGRRLLIASGLYAEQPEEREDQEYGRRKDITKATTR